MTSGHAAGGGTDLSFRVLGPVEASGPGGDVPLGGRRHRVLLATLLTDPGRVVSRERLIEALWGIDPPAKAVAMLHVRISELRKLLRARAGGSPDPVVTRHPGYLIAVPRRAVDSGEFEYEAAAGRRLLAAGDARAASARLAAALALWRGPAFADLGEVTTVRAEVSRLERLRDQALKDRIDADFAVGRYSETIAELAALIEEHPLDEWYAAKLMLGLYRDGRQADALDTYDNRWCVDWTMNSASSRAKNSHRSTWQYSVTRSRSLPPRQSPMSSPRRPRYRPRSPPSWVGRWNCDDVCHTSSSIG